MTYSEIDSLRTQIDLLIKKQLDTEAPLSNDDFVFQMREYEDLCSTLTAY